MSLKEVKPSPEEAFDCWAKELGFRGRDTLDDLSKSLRDQLHNMRTMFNEAFAREKPSSLHTPTLPLHFDYLDAGDVEQAIATDDGEHYAFVGMTRRMVLKISDFCVQLSRSDGTVCHALPVRPSATPYNELQAVLFYTLLTFVVAHEWSHHKHGHCGQSFSPERIVDQIKEIAADGYSAFHVLAHLFDSRSTFLPFLTFNPPPTEEVIDQVFLSFFIFAVGGYIFFLPLRDLNDANVYQSTHPPASARLVLLMEEVAAWCSHNRPALDGWLREQSKALMDVAIGTVGGAPDHHEQWNNQVRFLKSNAGQQYMAKLRDGISAYRKSWGVGR